MKIKNNNLHFRQGDLYFMKVNDFNKTNYTKREIKNNKLIRAYGETTGHHHSISLLDYPDVELFENKDGDMLLNVPNVAVLTHQEHTAIPLMPGKYEVYIQEEYDPEGMRRVQD